MVTLVGYGPIAPSVVDAQKQRSKSTGKPRKSSSQLRKDLRSVRTKMQTTKTRLRDTRRKEKRLVDEVEVVQARLTDTESHLESATRRMRRLVAERNHLERRISDTELRLNGRRGLLAQRLRENYQRGKTSYIQVLYRSRSVQDYLSRSYYVSRVVESDVELVQGIDTDAKQLAEDNADLERRLSELRDTREELKDRTEKYEGDVEYKQELLSDVRDNKEKLQQVLDELEAASSSIEARIRAMQLTARGQARLRQVWSGSFIRPAEGAVTSPFGMRFHPILRRTRLHTGVDIGARHGARIRAAAAGEVVVAGYVKAYGNTVIIDHGGGVTTLYGHCSSLGVSEGQTVKQGDVIARVGSTGLATGPHLHFEVRRNGTPVNPF